MVRGVQRGYERRLKALFKLNPDFRDAVASGRMRAHYAFGRNLTNSLETLDS